MKERSKSNQGVARNKRGTGGVLVKGVYFLTLSLVIANLYLFVKPGSSRPGLSVAPSEQSLLSSEENQNWKIYIDRDYGYSVKYPPLLEPRSIASENYISFIIFFVPEEVIGSGFAVSVRENTLIEEVVLIKRELGENSKAILKKEESLEKNGYAGTKLEYLPAQAGEGELRTVMIVNNGEYSFSLSSTPGFIDKVFSTLDFVN